MNPIRVLDRSIAERIAAGEVVERPASVVKELVENSLDAGALRITVEVEGAGLRLIRVSDDGAGIPAEEVPLAFERFATSKIERLEDLVAIQSYGFRGEALPSIAAVARVTLTTRTAGAPAATRAVVVGGQMETVTSHGAPTGTVVEVAALFFNTPARMKFLKSPAREQALIAEAVQRAAMARPEVAFALTVDGREAARWPTAAPGMRAADVLAAGDAGELIPIEGSVPSGRLTGWLGRLERCRTSRAGEFFFVNGRPVHSALLRRAVEQGYAQLLPVGRYPSCALFLVVVPASVDVNVHPRKLEVRFRNESGVFGAVVRTVREALLAAAPVRWVGGPPEAMRPSAASTADPVADPIPLALEAREPAAAYPATARRLPLLRPIGQLLNTYILAEGPDGLYLVDQHAAHERVLYERLLAARRRGRLTSQTLALPLTVDLTPAQMALVAGYGDHLAQIGLDAEPFGARTVVLRAVPAGPAGAAPEALLQRVLGALADGAGADRDDAATLERLAIATACHTAVRAGDSLSPEAIATLLTDLAATDDPFTCFHGRPTVVAVPTEHLERWFLRR